MELNQIAYVFDYVTSAIEQNELLADYDRLIDALSSAEDGAEDSAELVNQLRSDLVAKHEVLEPTNLRHVQRVIIEKYGANKLMGDVVADTLNQLFMDNFMNPTPIIEYVAGLRVDSAELLTQIKQLQTDLAPLLADAPLTGEPILQGDIDIDIIEDGAIVHYQQPSIEDQSAGGRMLQTIKGALNRNGRQPSSALTPYQETPLHIKMAAALPIAIAAAGKAIDLYRVYNDNKSTALAPVPEKKQLPATTSQTRVNVRQSVHYTYSQTTVYIDNRKK